MPTATTSNSTKKTSLWNSINEKFDKFKEGAKTTVGHAVVGGGALTGIAILSIGDPLAMVVGAITGALIGGGYGLKNAINNSSKDKDEFTSASPDDSIKPHT